MALHEFCHSFWESDLPEHVGTYSFVFQYTVRTHALLFFTQDKQVTDVVEQGREDNLILIAFLFCKLRGLTGMLNLRDGLTDVICSTTIMEHCEKRVNALFRLLQTRIVQ
jgi:hypothetical protein